MQCPQCQQTVDPGAMFCGNCGFQLAAAANNPGQTSGTPLSLSPAAPQPAQLSGQPAPSVAPLPEITPVDPGQVAPPAPQPVFQQPALPANPVQQLVGPPSPSYGGLQTPTDHSGKAIASFVLSILGLPGSLIPIVGIIFAILAIVFGTMSLHSARKVFAKIGIGIGIFVLLVSVFFWVNYTQDILKEKQNGTSGTSSSDSRLQQAVTTPCYTTKVPAAMKITQTEGSCTFLAVSANSGEQQQVKVLQVPELTAANLATAATADAQNVVGAIPGGSITKQSAATFAGSPAYEIEVKATDGSAGTISYVYDTTTQGNLVIVLHTQAKAATNNYDLSAIESNWAWL